MTSDRAGSVASRNQASARAITVLAAFLAMTTVGVLALSAAHLQWQSQALIRASAIAALAVLYKQASSRLANSTPQLGASVHVKMVTVWILAAALSLPTTYVGFLVLALIGHDALRRDVSGHRMSRRQVPSCLGYVLASVAASWVFNALRPDSASRYGGAQAVAVVAGVASYIVLAGLVLALLDEIAAEPGRWRDRLPSRDAQALEVATIVLGVLAAQLLSQTIFLTPIVLVLMALLQRSALVAQLQIAATTDAKTGLLNAAAWQEMAQRELLRAQRDRTPGAVMLLDLDHFKRLNDTLGHLRGDAALKAVSEALGRELRGYDAVARFGGEEFVVFLNELPLVDATVVAERVLTRIRNLAITGLEPNGPRYLLTASIGLASYPEHGGTIVELLEAADLALYGAKNGGRDRIGLPEGSRATTTQSVTADRPAEQGLPRSRAREAS